MRTFTTTSALDPRTQAACSTIDAFASEDVSDKLLVELAVIAALDTAEGLIDSHVLADSMFARRLAARDVALAAIAAAVTADDTTTDGLTARDDGSGPAATSNAAVRRAKADISWEQTRDYVQHLLRETTNVCRHGDGHHYRVHRAALCSDTCDTRYGHIVNAPVISELCPTCFIMMNVAGECGYCA